MDGKVILGNIPINISGSTWQFNPNPGDNNIYLWGANLTNYYYNSRYWVGGQYQNGVPLSGGALGSGTSHKNYVGVVTTVFNNDSDLNVAIAANKKVFNYLRDKLAEGRTIVLPTFHNRYSLGTGHALTQMNPGIWERLTVSIIDELLRLYPAIKDQYVHFPFDKANFENTTIENIKTRLDGLIPSTPSSHATTTTTTTTTASTTSEWITVRDNVSGRDYYYNAATKESRWDKPLMAIVHPATVPVATTAVADSALPSGWVMKYDTNHKHNYYYNAATKKSRWDKPEAITVHPAATDSTLPSGWVMKYDTNHKHNYYYNAATKKSRWDKPEAITVHPATVHPVTVHPATVHPVTVPVATTAVADSALPSGWVMKYDTNHKHNYYYNAATGESTWTKPGGAVSIHGCPKAIPLIKTNNNWTLTSSAGVKRDGTYAFNAQTGILTIQQSTPSAQRTAKMICVEAGAGIDAVINNLYPHRNLIDSRVNLISSEISHEIFTPKPGVRRIFVLPSQLNGAEYVGPNIDPNNYTLNNYRGDPTGGPRGQLAGDPGVASFILDNACSSVHPESGINNIRYVLPVDGLNLINGYLLANKEKADYATYANKLKYMTVVGFSDITACGLSGVHYDKWSSFNHKVDLVYASAMPVNGSYGQKNSKEVNDIGYLTLVGQYVCSLRLAVMRAPCEVNMMPLGGGVFKNSIPRIAQAICRAIEIVKPPSTVKMNLLCFNLNPTELQAFNEFNTDFNTKYRPGSATTTAVTTAAVTDPTLPSGWVMKYDNIHKHSYYYNAASGISTWDKPILPSPVPAPSPAPVPAPAPAPSPALSAITPKSTDTGAGVFIVEQYYNHADRNETSLILVHDKAAKKYTVPGGTRDPGENLRDTARREMREETANLFNFDRDILDGNFAVRHHQFVVYFVGLLGSIMSAQYYDNLLLLSIRQTLQRNTHDYLETDQLVRVYIADLIADGVSTTTGDFHTRDARGNPILIEGRTKAIIREAIKAGFIDRTPAYVPGYKVNDDVSQPNLRGTRSYSV
jgi:ADP-ribose pyrophosphatase YjhB (NUDIX family)